MTGIQAARAYALTLVRRGPRTVLWTPPRVNLGNFLYHWLQVFRQREEGRQCVALETPEMVPWFPFFPGIQGDYTITRAQVRMTDRREPGFWQGWGRFYWPEHVERFVDMMREVSTLPLDAPEDRTDRVVVNVRRGDYFSPKFIHYYSFDQVAYLRVAVERARRLGDPISTFHVVSDDVAWCREHLAWLADDGIDLTFAPAASTPADDFAALATARRLILTHSTFGYWGAHFSNGIYGDNHADVIVPWFHDRTMWSGAASQLNPAWTVVKDIPGGWVPGPLPPSRADA